MCTQCYIICAHVRIQYDFITKGNYIPFFLAYGMPTIIFQYANAQHCFVGHNDNNTGLSIFIANMAIKMSHFACGRLRPAVNGQPHIQILNSHCCLDAGGSKAISFCVQSSKKTWYFGSRGGHRHQLWAPKWWTTLLDSQSRCTTLKMYWEKTVENQVIFVPASFWRDIMYSPCYSNCVKSSTTTFLLLLHLVHSANKQLRKRSTAVLLFQSGSLFWAAAHPCE
jgi:hypothetical protein